MRTLTLALALMAGCPAGDGGDDDDTGEGEVFRPARGTTWQWQLQGAIDTSFDVAVYDIDLFDVDAAVIAALHGDGRKVLCYLSVGTFEPFRDDADQYPDEVKGNRYEPPFEEELYVDVRDERVLAILEARFDLAVSKGCDGVEPDNVDLHDQDTGFAITPAENLAFNRILAAAAHTRGLSVGLKNNLTQLDALVDDFDWALNEQCFEFSECAVYAENFLAQDKAVFHAEYDGVAADVCLVTTALGISTILKDRELFADVTFCP
jgi:hypothetical protein